MFKAIEHVGIKVADLERSIDFYTRTLGFRLVERGVRADVGLELAFLEAPGGGTQIELIHPVGHSGGLTEGVVNHFSFSVDDIDAAVAHLRSKGFGDFDRPDERPRGPQNRLLLRAGWRKVGTLPKKSLVGARPGGFAGIVVPVSNG